MIIKCCFLDVEGTKTNRTRSYVVRYLIITDVPYEPHALRDEAQSISDCLDTIGSPYQGIPSSAYPTAISEPDPGSTLQSIQIGKRKKKGELFNYVATLNYDVVLVEPPALPPTGETSDNPLDWCPLYRERTVSREVAAAKAIFRGLYTNGDVPENCDIDGCACPEFDDDPVTGNLFPLFVPGTNGYEIGDCITPVNTAGDAITGLTRELADTEISLTFWKAVGDWDVNGNRCKKLSLNNAQVDIGYPCWGPDPFATIKPGTGLISFDNTLRARDVDNFGLLRYWEISHEIRIRECGWYQQLRNDGYYRVADNETAPGSGSVDDGAGGVFNGLITGGRATNTPILPRAETGFALTEPVPLDLNGQPIETRDIDDEIWGLWETLTTQDWSTLF